MELAEVYRVQYQGRDDILRGIIVCKDSETGYQCLFKDQGLEDEVINNTLLMLNNDDNNPDCAHLCLQQRTARTSAIERPAYSSIIFNEECGIFIELGSGGDIVIPLLRDIVAVPLGHQLILEINLSGKDNDGKKDSDKMVEDYLVFDAIDDGKSTKSISGSKGELRVEVSWRSREKSH
ncbi:uncharacterized protein LOC108204676 [Daucus carota subsp. sativus]|uniref:uncharacterized protein LOC108204676 n=1 Tax=Daucus carota subsp. sativus TaxID=79200 RepID=UPI0007EFBEBA|nr:PREDICTED: uncharacterized protein LOC108204676 [Daucus carota subsp. sativus]